MDLIRTHHSNNRIILTKNNYGQQPHSQKPFGLWYDINNSWLEWCQQEMEDRTHKYHFELELDKSKMLIINIEAQLLLFDKKYTSPLLKLPFMKYPNWAKVSENYSGIEISPYQQNQRLELDWYYGWDIASGCIWNFDCVKSIKKVKYD